MSKFFLLAVGEPKDGAGASSLGNADTMNNSFNNPNIAQMDKDTFLSGYSGDVTTESFHKLQEIVKGINDNVTSINSKLTATKQIIKASDVNSLFDLSVDMWFMILLGLLVLSILFICWQAYCKVGNNDIEEIKSAIEKKVKDELNKYKAENIKICQDAMGRLSKELDGTKSERNILKERINTLENKIRGLEVELKTLKQEHIDKKTDNQLDTRVAFTPQRDRFTPTPSDKDKIKEIKTLYNNIRSRAMINPINDSVELRKNGDWLTLYCQNVNDIISGSKAILSENKTSSPHFEACRINSDIYMLVPSIREPWSYYEVNNSLRDMYDVSSSQFKNGRYDVSKVLEATLCKKNGNNWEIIDGYKGRLEMKKL